MKLLYINALNKNHKGESLYEFIFGRTTEIEYGDNWDAIPASASEVTPPPIDYIHQVGIMISDEIELDCVQYSDFFSVIDAVDTIVALGWEKTPIDDVARLVFHFGDDIDSVQDKLYSRDIELNLEKNNKYAAHEKN